MPTFDTPEPIQLTIEIPTGHIRIDATDRTDTVVDVRPSDPDIDNCVQAAERTRVEFSGGRLHVQGAKSRGIMSWLLWKGQVEVTVALPAGSRVQVSGGADLLATGRLGESVVRTSNGDVRLERTGPADLRTDNGEISVDWVNGPAEVGVTNGSIHLGTVDGDGTLTSSTGDITVGRARADVTARSAYGRIRVGEVTRGSTRLETGYGKVHVGIAEGTAAWLDLSSKWGTVRNSLTATEGPGGDAEETVEVRAHTNYGDVEVHRSRSF